MQVSVSKQKGGIGFLFWNANNNYSKPYEAMPTMRSAKLFRGDELGALNAATPEGSTDSAPHMKLVTAPAR